MNAVTQASLGLPDTQSLADRRGLAIDGAGIRGLRLPARVTDVGGRSVPTVLEAQASCEVYGLLKRPDEKYVTERTYENPKFVEDMVRDVYLAVTALPPVHRATVVCENLESIHNHSAYALIDGAGLY
jgi:GTP cyclohydrolase FolE2